MLLCMLAGHLLPSATNSPTLGSDYFSTIFQDTRDMSRPLQGLPLMDLPLPGRVSSLEHMLDGSPSHMLSDARCDSYRLVPAQVSLLPVAGRSWLWAAPGCCNAAASCFNWEPFPRQLHMGGDMSGKSSRMSCDRCLSM